MGEINKQITINAPVKKMYAYVSNPRNAPHYISSISRVLSGPEEEPAPKQVWRVEADFLGQKRIINLRIAELIPNKLVRFVLEGDPEAELDVRLISDESTDSTTVKLSLEANGVPSVLMNALLGGLLSEDLVRLKRQSES